MKISNLNSHLPISSHNPKTAKRQISSIPLLQNQNTKLMNRMINKILMKSKSLTINKIMFQIQPTNAKVFSKYKRPNINKNPSIRINQAKNIQQGYSKAIKIIKESRLRRAMKITEESRFRRAILQRSKNNQLQVKMFMKLLTQTIKIRKK